MQYIFLILNIRCGSTNKHTTLFDFKRTQTNLPRGYRLFYRFPIYLYSFPNLQSALSRKIHKCVLNILCSGIIKQRAGPYPHNPFISSLRNAFERLLNAALAQLSKLLVCYDGLHLAAAWHTVLNTNDGPFIH